MDLMLIMLIMQYLARDSSMLSSEENDLNDFDAYFVLLFEITD